VERYASGVERVADILGGVVIEGDPGLTEKRQNRRHPSLPDKWRSILP
jgi:hypothetical protein